jgi:hypothetical protein
MDLGSVVSDCSVFPKSFLRIHEKFIPVSFQKMTHRGLNAGLSLPDYRQSSNDASYKTLIDPKPDWQRQVNFSEPILTRENRISSALSLDLN